MQSKGNRQRGDKLFKISRQRKQAVNWHLIPLFILFILSIIFLISSPLTKQRESKSDIFPVKDSVHCWRYSRSKKKEFLKLPFRCQIKTDQWKISLFWPITGLVIIANDEMAKFSFRPIESFYYPLCFHRISFVFKVLQVFFRVIKNQIVLKSNWSFQVK